jgi:hypothetical protein
MPRSRQPDTPEEPEDKEMDAISKTFVSARIQLDVHEGLKLYAQSKNLTLSRAIDEMLKKEAPDMRDAGRSIARTKKRALKATSQPEEDEGEE